MGEETTTIKKGNLGVVRQNIIHNAKKEPKFTCKNKESRCENYAIPK